MHPPLALHVNPVCAELITAFKACHDECGYIGKLTGACNDEKHALDLCFKEQKKVTRKGLLAKAREDRARFRELCKDDK